MLHQYTLNLKRTLINVYILRLCLVRKYVYKRIYLNVIINYQLHIKIFFSVLKGQVINFVYSTHNRNTDDSTRKKIVHPNLDRYL